MDIGTLTGRIELEETLSHGLEVVSHQVEKFAEEFVGELGLIGVGIGVAVAAIVGMTAAVTALGVHGSEIHNVEEGFRVLTGSVEESEAIMRAMRSGTKNTIDDFVLMKDATKMLSAGVKITADDFGTLSQAAVILSHRGFGDTTAILDTLSSAMITGRTRAVSLMMGIIDAKDAQHDYQTEVLGTTDTLNKYGQVEAVRQAILAKSRDLIGSAGEQEATFAERIKQAETAVTNFVDALGVAVAVSPTMKLLMDAIGNAFTSAFGDNQTTMVKTIIGYVNQFAIFLVDLGIAATTVATVAVAGFGIIKVAVLAVEVVIVGLISGFVSAYAAIASFMAKLPGATQATRDLAKSASEEAEAWKSSTAGLISQGDEAMKMVTGQSSLNKTIDSAAGGLMNLKDKMEEASKTEVTNTQITNALGKEHSETKDMTEKHTKAVQALYDSLIGGVAKVSVVTDAFKKLTAEQKADDSVQLVMMSTVDKLASSHKKLTPELKTLYDRLVSNRIEVTNNEIALLKADGVTQSHINLLKFQGMTEQQIATQYGVNTKSLQDYQVVLKDQVAIRTLEGAVAGLTTTIGNASEAEHLAVVASIALYDGLKTVERTIPGPVAGFEMLGVTLTSLGRKSTEIENIQVALEHISTDPVIRQMEILGYKSIETLQRTAAEAKTNYDKMVAEGTKVWTAAEIAKARQAWQDANDNAIGKTKFNFSTLSSALSTLSNDFVQMAQIAGDTWGGILRLVGGVIKVIDMATKSVDTFQKASKSMAGATSADYAAMFSSWIGIGAAIGQMAAEYQNNKDHLATLRQETEWMDREQKRWNTDIKLTWDKFGDLVSIVHELGGMAALTADQAKHLGDMLDLALVNMQNDANRKKSMGELNALLAQMGQTAIDSGHLVSQTFLDLIAHAKALGIEVEGVNDLILGQLKSAADGLNAMFGGMSKSLGDSFKVTQAQGAGLAAALVANFGEMIDRGMSFGDALKALQPSIDILTESMKRSGVEGSGAFNLLSELSSLAADKIAGPLFDAISGANTALKGLHNSGILNQEMFTGLETTAVDAYNKIISGGGSAAAANMAIAPTLQTLWSLQQDFGYAVDDATQQLIDQAVAAGSVGDKHRPIAEQMLLATNKIADAMAQVVELMGGKMPAAAKVGADGINDAFSKIHTVKIDAPWKDWGAVPTGGGDIESHASGGVAGYTGNVIAGPWAPIGTDTVPAMLTRGERVLSVSQTRAYDASGHRSSQDDGARKDIARLRDDIIVRLPNILTAAMKSARAA